MQKFVYDIGSRGGIFEINFKLTAKFFVPERERERERERGLVQNWAKQKGGKVR